MLLPEATPAPTIRISADFPRMASASESADERVAVGVGVAGARVAAGVAEGAPGGGAFAAVGETEGVFDGSLAALATSSAPSHSALHGFATAPGAAALFSLPGQAAILKVPTAVLGP